MSFFNWRKRGVISSSLGLMHPKHLAELNRHAGFLIKTRLWLQILVALFLGVVVGLILNPSRGIISANTALILGEWLALPGNFFLTIIQMIVVPLIMASIMRSIAANKSISQLRKNGLGLLFYLLITSVIAIIIGIVIGTVIQPGAYINPDTISNKNVQNLTISENEPITLQNIPSGIVSIFPSNPISAMINSQMLQIVMFSFIIGFALLSISARNASPLVNLLGSIQSVSMAIVKWVMLIAPLAVFGLIAKLMMETGIDVLYGLGIYVLTVLFGLFVLMLFFLTLVLFIGKMNPLSFMANTKDALLLAFSTDSSAATMPLSIKTAEEKLNIQPTISQFVIPIGATINMSGTALYQGLATMFMAQLFGISLPLSALLALIVTAIGASIGTPATPGVGIVVLSSVLVSAGIPLAGIPLILGVDRILEMSRATLNVMGDLVGCVVLQRFSKKGNPKIKKN